MKNKKLFIPFFRITHVLIDFFLIIVVYISVFIIRFEGNIPQQHLHQFWIFLPLITLIRLICNYFLGLYQHLWKYFGTKEAIDVVKATVIGSVVFILIVYISGNSSFPRSIFLFEWSLNLTALVGVRFSRRFSQEIMINRKKPVSRTLIIGAGDAGEMLVREMLRHPENGFLPVGFIDDNPDKWKARIHNIKVFGPRDKIIEIVENWEIDVIIIAIPSAEPKVIRDIVDICTKTKVSIKIIPAIHEIINGTVSINHVREIKIEDLLGREPIVIEDSDLFQTIQGKKVLVTGAGGSIGSELCRQLINYKPEILYLLGHGENSIFQIHQELKNRFSDIKTKQIIADIRNINSLKKIFSEFKPEIIFHAAAHKHVPLMEENLIEAIDNNIIGTKILSDLSIQYNVERFVLISSDKAVNPSSIMGLTKRIAELVIQIQSKNKNVNTKFITVRFGNVIGSRGSVIPIFEEQIKKGGPITITDPEMTRYFMTIPEAVQLVLQASSLGQGGDIFILDMGEPIKIVDLAKNMIRLSGFSEDEIGIIYTGNRGGEKLYEELICSNETKIRTKHHKIFSIIPNDSNLENIKNHLNDLLENLFYYNKEQIWEKLLYLVPDYNNISTKKG